MRELAEEAVDRTEHAGALLIAAASAALLTLLPVAAHQVGLVGHIADPPGDVFASDVITESKTAHPFGVPDGVLGMGSYGATLALALLSRSEAVARPLLAAKLVADGGVAAFNVVRQIVVFGKICSWCTGTAIATAVMVYAGRGVIREQAARMSGGIDGC